MPAFFLALFPFFAATAQDVPLAYKAKNGQYLPTTIVTKLDGNQNPLLYTYKGNDNLWHNAEISAFACGVDSDGHPTACPEPVSMSALNSYIPLVSINKPAGVAGLNTKSAITAPLSSIGSSNFLDTNNVSVLAVNPSQADDTVPGRNYWNLMKPHAFLVGGTRVGTLTDGDYGADSQLYIVGHADGIGGQGCLLCIHDGPGSVTDFLPGISTNWNTIAGIASYGSADQSLEYISASNQPSTLELSVASYTATEIVLGTPMTAEQIARIHFGMYVMTNSIDTSVATPAFSASSDLPAKNYYASLVDHVIDSTHIAVIGWAVPGQNNATVGQIPSTSNLDTVWTNFGTPTVGIGANTGSGIFNWRIDHNDVTNSWVHEYGAEYDIRNSGLAGSLRVTPLTIVEEGNAPSANSWGFKINAPMNPDLLELDGGANSKIINAPGAFFANGSGSTSTSTPDHEFGEWDAFLDSVDNIRLAAFMHRNSGSTGYVSAEVYIGAHANDAFGNSPYTATSGAMMGALGLNVGGNVGSASLCGGSSVNVLTCSLRVNFDGAIYAQSNINASGDVITSGNISANNGTISTKNSTVSDQATFSSLSGTGNAYACLDASGKLYRSSSPCN
ncbi:hypothetical protein JK202_01135 [Gluconobacter sp. Dm-62]|uniref:hypothetical protein n=1 Tax=Gluconobacter sp. Dm-62 TaxID=2799804 RepID=UPI001B8AEBCF|nr:hypothetical protein [Gluconobacter sp. Dm-62]MBS1101632.1 hypothetical protein [Gluconobacter sp. Dm-62]